MARIEDAIPEKAVGIGDVVRDAILEMNSVHIYAATMDGGRGN
ncbi:MAG: hypothetical protein AAF390_07965 [Pseudomonadota bacterium]